MTTINADALRVEPMLGESTKRDGKVATRLPHEGFSASYDLVLVHTRALFKTLTIN
jgi:hypothetical protein